MKYVKRLKEALRLLLPVAVIGTIAWVLSSYDEIEAEIPPREVNLADWAGFLNEMSLSLGIQFTQNRLQGDFSFEEVIEIPDDLTYWDQLSLQIDEETGEIEDEGWAELSREFWLQQAPAAARILGHVFNNMQNIQFFALDLESEEEAFNHEALREAALGNFDQERLSHHFQDVAVFSFDETGHQEVDFYFEKSGNLNRSPFYWNWQGSTPVHSNFHMDPPAIWRNPTNMVVAFGIPQQLLYADPIAWNLQFSRPDMIQQSIILHSVFAFIFVGLIALILPLSIMKTSLFWRNLLKTPLEIVLLLIYGSFHLVIGFFPSMIMEAFNFGFSFNWAPLATLENTLFLFHIVMWGAVCTFAAFLVLYIKQLFTQGVIRSLLNNSLLFGIPYYFYRTAQLDLSTPIFWKLMKVFLLQFLVISGIFFIISAMLGNEEFLFVGILGGIAFLFMMLLIYLKTFSNYRKDYFRIFEFSKQLAGGIDNDQNAENFGIFGGLAQQLTEVKKKIADAVTAKTFHEKVKVQLITAAAGEMAQPLAVLQEQLGFLKNPGLERDLQLTAIDTLDDAAARLENLSSGIYEAGRAASGSLGGELKAVDLAVLVDDVFVELEELLVKSGLEIRRIHPESSLSAFADPIRSKRIFQLLLSNMAKHTMPNTRAYVTFQESGDDIAVILRNISAKELDFNLDLLDESQAALGLTTAKSLVEIQGGTFKAFTDGDLFKVIITLRKA